MTSMLRARTLIATIVVGLLLGGTADLAAAAASPAKKQSQSSHPHKKQAKKKRKQCKKPKRNKHKHCKKPKRGRTQPPATKPGAPGGGGALPEKVFQLTAEGTYEHTRSSLGPPPVSFFSGATTRLRWTATGTVAVARTGAGPKELRARTVSFAASLVGLEEDRVTRAQTPRPDGSWVTCETASSERLARPVPLAGTLVGARPDVLGPSFLDADVAVDRQVSGTADPICLPPFGGGPDTRHVYPMDLVWLPPVESDWEFLCSREGSFEAGWKVSCRQFANRAGREAWEFSISLTP